MTTTTTRLLSFDVGVRHLAYADVSVTGADAYTIHRWNLVDVTGGRKLRGVDELSAAIIDVLDRELFDPAVRYDHVLVENQPANKNPAMKSVQMVICTYFAVLRHYVGNVASVRMVSATRKLTLRHAPPSCRDAADEYRQRKAQAVYCCEHYLAEVFKSPAATTQLAASKKKDDLCDCLLQAVWFAEVHLNAR
jgi:hypothetical protein